MSNLFPYLPTRSLVAMQDEVMSASKVPAEKDIILVVHNQLDCVKACVESIQQHTENYNLFIYDNGSDASTRSYLKSLGDDVTLCRDEANRGFIYPNNFLVKHGHAPFIIPINSDVIVYEGWDLVLTGYLEQYPQVAQVGFLGGYLDARAQGVAAGFGGDIDYICGWCFCIPRSVYEEFGLFDETNLEFAYGEDSDFSMRLREAGRRIYALQAPLAHHFGNKTVKEVMQEMNITPYLTKNHEYLRRRWQKFLPSG
jgi:GT2 family glycosyltransferase